MSSSKVCRRVPAPSVTKGASAVWVEKGVLPGETISCPFEEDFLGAGHTVQPDLQLEALRMLPVGGWVCASEAQMNFSTENNTVEEKQTREGRA